MRCVRLLLLGALFLVRCQCNHAACFENGTLAERIEIRDRNNAVLWRLDGDGQHAVGNVEWGIVPAGYRQLSPGSGAPRALKTGEPVLLLWKAGGYFARHWGTAASPAVIHYGVWNSSPIAGRRDDQFFVDEPRTIDPTRGYPAP
jgi:hypothetical protein